MTGAQQGVPGRGAAPRRGPGGMHHLPSGLGAVQEPGGMERPHPADVKPKVSTLARFWNIYGTGFPESDSWDWRGARGRHWGSCDTVVLPIPLKCSRALALLTKDSSWLCVDLNLLKYF